MMTYIQKSEMPYLFDLLIKYYEKNRMTTKPDKEVEDLIQLLNQINIPENPDNLPSLYFRCLKIGNKNIHLFLLVLTNLSSVILLELMEKLKSEYLPLLSQELMKIYNQDGPLYQALLKFKEEGHERHSANLLHNKIIELVEKHLTDRMKMNLIVSLYENLSWSLISRLVREMSPASRLELMLSSMPDVEQNILIEKIAQEGLEGLLEILDSFKDNEERFTILTTQLNNDLLIFRMMKINPGLMAKLPELLEDCTGLQLSILFQKADERQLSLFHYLASRNSKERVTALLSKASYCVSDDKKMLDPRKINFAKMRDELDEVEDGDGFVGLYGLLIIYNYIAVRLNEGDDAVFQESYDEFKMMLQVLIEYKSSSIIKVKLKQHCDDHPLRQGWSIYLPLKRLELGTSRHHEAREKLLELKVEELKKGIELFEQFLILRLQGPAEALTLDIDKTLLSAFNRQQIISGVAKIYN